MYWIFTAGRIFLSGLLPALVCLTPITVLVSAAIRGAGIRRTGEETSTPSGWQRGLTWLSYALMSLTASSIYVTLFGDLAVRRGRSTTNPFIRLITGAPPSIDATRLFAFGMVGAMLVLISVIVLHSLIRDGGWLRERIDRLRVPPVKRGALGSSHFCTPREYRRYRRPEGDGLTLLGAFWGAGKRRSISGVANSASAGRTSRAACLPSAVPDRARPRR